MFLRTLTNVGQVLKAGSQAAGKNLTLPQVHPVSAVATANTLDPAYPFPNLSNITTTLGGYGAGCSVSFAPDGFIYPLLAGQNFPGSTPLTIALNLPAAGAPPAPASSPTPTPTPIPTPAIGVPGACPTAITWTDSLAKQTKSDGTFTRYDQIAINFSSLDYKLVGGLPVQGTDNPNSCPGTPGIPAGYSDITAISINGQLGFTFSADGTLTVETGSSNVVGSLSSCLYGPVQVLLTCSGQISFPNNQGQITTTLQFGYPTFIVQLQQVYGFTNGQLTKTYTLNTLPLSQYFFDPNANPNPTQAQLDAAVESMTNLLGISIIQ